VTMPYRSVLFAASSGCMAKANGTRPPTFQGENRRVPTTGRLTTTSVGCGPIIENRPSCCAAEPRAQPWAMDRRPALNDVLALRMPGHRRGEGAGARAFGARWQSCVGTTSLQTDALVAGEGRGCIGQHSNERKPVSDEDGFTRCCFALFVGIRMPIGPKPIKRSLLLPVQPIHVTIAAWFTIGNPVRSSCRLAPNKRGGYQASSACVTSALPSGLRSATATLVSYLVAYRGPPLPLRRKTGSKV